MASIVYSEDFFGDAFILDPVSHYKAVRDIGPVVWVEKNSCYAVTHDASARDVLRRADTFTSGRGLSLNDDVNKLLVGNTLNSDGTIHMKQRSVTAVPIMPKNIAPLGDYIRDLSEDVAGKLTAATRFDAVSEFAQILPLAVVIDLIGLNEVGRQKMLPWAAAAFNLFEGYNARSKAAFGELVDLQNFLKTYGRRDALKDGGLAQRIFDVAPDKGFTEDQAAQLMRDYINPSLDTTISAAGFAAYYFAKFPDQWTELRANPDLVPNAVEEIVRMATPIRAFSRYIEEDTEISDVAVAGGSRVLVVYAAANRDEAVWEDPDRFDVRRDVRKHLGFGHGVHTCMGLHLARLELVSLINAMLPRVASWHLDGPPVIAMNNTIRAFESLPVRVQAA